MPVVEQYNWDKMKPKTKDSIKNDKPNDIDKRYWRYKKKTPPKAPKYKDVHLGRAISHLKSIMREE